MYKRVKRFFDVFFSGLAIVVMSPLIIPISLILKFTGEGYIFYRQERVGYKQGLFNIYKFATMLKNSPNMTGGLITIKKDPRLLPIGGFLRSSKINELPQLLNILFGHMSFVGPRPVMAKSFEAYPDEVKKVIYNVKPGLTGIGSIIFRDEERLITEIKDKGGDVWDFYKNSIYPFKGQVEKWYQANQCFLTDFKVLIITAWVILFPKSEIVYRWFPTLQKRPF
jgi:lipopolysaccharide/colanic/teichoic acid biosynthesis glycosyltransferase